MVAFTSWRPLQRHEITAIPNGPAAVQVRRAAGLVEYPTGRSAMVAFLWSSDARAAVAERFAEELDEPGTLGHGPLLVRHYAGDDSRDVLAKRLVAFERRFGALPTPPEGAAR